MLRCLNPLSLFLLARPPMVLALSFAIGLALCLGSIFVGCGLFAVTILVTPEPAGTAVSVPLDLGYITQLNYGPWYVFGCPVLLFFASLAAYSTKRCGPQDVRDRASFQALMRRPAIATLGLVILILAVWKNVAAEYRDYNHLAFGWVQAEQAERWAGTIAKTGRPVSLSLAQFNFHYIDLLPDAKGARGRLTRPRRIDILDVSPRDIHVRSGVPLLTFIGIAKLWVAVWESLVVYISALTALWGVAVIRSITPETVTATCDGSTAFWAEPTAVFLLLAGILTNVFSISRYLANAVKGSFGLPDQYESLLTLMPGFVAIALGAAVFYRAFDILPTNRIYVISKTATALALAWLLTIVALMLLLIEFIDPRMYVPLVDLLCQLPFKTCPASLQS